MSSIASIGIYIPRFRIEAAEINKSWGRSGGRGQKAVAAADEDVLTMGIEAAKNCIADAAIDKSSLGAVYFATVSSGYAEYALAAQVASVLGLPNSVRVADLGLSTRSATSAIQAAVDAIKLGQIENALVVTSDRLIAEPGSEYELNYGSGAGAVLISKQGLAEIDQIESYTSDFVGRSRQEGQWHGLVDDRFIMKYGYIEELLSAANRLNFKSAEFDHAVLQSPDPRWASKLTKALKLSPEASKSSLSQIGFAGCASFVVDLALALENSQTGDRILALSYGPGGGDALSIRVDESLSASFAERINDGTKISYPEYLRMTKLLGANS